ncbi:MAG: hypothetical protein AAGF12_06575 [Myxococcota bacterium]
MSFVQRCLALLVALLGLVGAGCSAAPSDGAVNNTELRRAGSADNAVDGPLFSCVIARDDQNGFSRADELECTLPSDTPFTHVTVAVHSATNRHLAEVSLSNGPLRTIIREEYYPLRIEGRFHSFDESTALLGLEHSTWRTSFEVATAEELAAAAGPVFPFEVWTLQVQSRLAGRARVYFDPYELRLEDAEIQQRGSWLDSVTVEPRSLTFDGGVSETYFLAVPFGTSQVTGSIRPDATGESVGFELTGPANLLLTPRGFEEAAPTEPTRLEPRFPFVTCIGFEAFEHCRVVPRHGIELGQVEVIIDGATAELPVDGAWHFIPQGTTAFGRVEIRGGIDGIDSSEVFEGPLTPIRYRTTHPGEVEPEFAAAFEAPFDLIHAVVNVGDEGLAQLDAAAHEVRLEGGDRDGTTIQRPISAFVSPDDPDVWLAVSRGTRTLDLDVTYWDISGDVFEGSATVEHATYILDMDGLTPPRLASPDDEAVACWFARSDVVCKVPVDGSVEAGTVSVRLDGVEGGAFVYSLANTLTSRAYPFSELEDFFPLTLELRVTLEGQREQVRRIRLLAPSDLPEERRLFIERE